MSIYDNDLVCIYEFRPVIDNDTLKILGDFVRFKIFLKTFPDLATTHLARLSGVLLVAYEIRIYHYSALRVCNHDELELDEVYCMTAVFVMISESIGNGLYSWKLPCPLPRSRQCLIIRESQLVMIFRILIYEIRLLKHCFESDKHHSDHNDTLKMNLGTEIQYTLSSVICFMLSCIFYGKHRPTTAFGLDTDL